MPARAAVRVPPSRPRSQPPAAPLPRSSAWSVRLPVRRRISRQIPTALRAGERWTLRASAPPPRAAARPGPDRLRLVRPRRRRSVRPYLRTSINGAAAGVNRATTVLPRTTGSPGSSSIRSTRPMTGADTTNRSRTRVSPSSSMVTCMAPLSTLATSTSMALGQRPTARVAAMMTRTAISRGFLSNRMSPNPARRSTLSLTPSLSTRRRDRACRVSV